MGRTKRKTLRFVHQNKTFTFGVIAAIALLALFIQGIMIAYQSHRIEKLEAENLKTLLITAAQGMDMEFAVDPMTGRQYIPKSRLVLPPPIESVSVKYNEGEGTSLIFKDKYNVQNAISNMNSAVTVEGIFKEVEVFQVCNRQIEMRYDERVEEGVKKVATKTLRDGRIANFYQEDNCPHDATQFMSYLIQIESF